MKTCPECGRLRVQNSQTGEVLMRCLNSDCCMKNIYVDAYEKIVRTSWLHQSASARHVSLEEK